MITTILRKHLPYLFICTMWLCCDPLLASTHLSEDEVKDDPHQVESTLSTPSHQPNEDENLQRIDKNIHFSILSAQDADPWFGQDKALHVTLSTGIGGGATLASQNSWLGLSVCLGIGLAKELIYDQVVPNHTPSYKDMIANTLGCSVGALAGHFVTR